MKFALKYPEKIKALTLNGGNLNTAGIKGTTQFFIELGYKIAKKFQMRNSSLFPAIILLLRRNPKILTTQLTN